MGIRSILSAIVKGKVVAAALVSTALVSGATVAMASTPAQQLLHHTVAAASAAKTATPTVQKGNQHTATPGAKAHGTPGKDDHAQQCAGLTEVQQLATKFSLSTTSKSDDVKAICSLHDGDFKGTTTNGTSISTSTRYGYGEIDQLLTDAQSLATHNGGKLTDDNVRTYLANALHTCGQTPLVACLKANTPTPHPGNSGNANNNGNNGNNDNGGNNGKGKGKPTGTPTPKH